MGILASIGVYIGGLILFLALSSFIMLYAVEMSGVTSPAFINEFVAAMVNTSSLSSISSISTISARSNISSQNLTAIESALGINASCGLPCLLGKISVGGTSTNLSQYLSNADISLYTLLSGILALFGAIIVLLSSKGGDRSSNIGKTTLSVAIFNFATYFIIFSVMLPYMNKLTINGINIKIPMYLITPFANDLYILDAIFGTFGIVLIVVGYIINTRYGKNIQPAAQTEQKSMKGKGKN